MALGNLEPADFPESAQIRQGQNIFIAGSSGTGKSYIATAGSVSKSMLSSLNISIIDVEKS